MVASTASSARSAPAARWPASPTALRAQKPDVAIGLADPGGAALYDYYAHGELKAEGTSISEGIGQGRITANLEGLKVDYPYRVDDEEMMRAIIELGDEGLVMGGSTGINVAGAVSDGARPRAGPHHRHHPCRLRLALSEQAVQPGVPEGTGAARAALA